MALRSAQMREDAAAGAVSAATHLSLFSTVPGASPGTELAGGTPAYARKAASWTAGAVDGTVTATATFDVPAGSTVAGYGLHTALTGGTYLDGAATASQPFTTQGTYTLTATLSIA